MAKFKVLCGLFFVLFLCCFFFIHIYSIDNHRKSNSSANIISQLFLSHITQYNRDPTVQRSTVLEIPKLPSGSQPCQYGRVQCHETRLAQVPKAMYPHYLFHSCLLPAWRSPAGTSAGISAPRSIACCGYHFVVPARLVSYTDHPELHVAPGLGDECS